MEYSEENLMKLISQVSHQAGHNGRTEPGEPEHGQKWEQGENPDRTGRAGGRVGYPNCPGPGCGNNCPYKGTEECPKTAAGNAGGEKGYGGHGEHGGRGSHGGHGEHESHGGYGGHGGHGSHSGHGIHGGHGGGYPGTGDVREPLGRERILTLLDEEGPLSQSTLAARLKIRPQSVSELLVKLEKDGYIVRTPNEQDKREILVSLSPAGKQRAAEVRKSQEEQASDFLAPLNEDERKTLFDLLVKLTPDTAEKEG